MLLAGRVTELLKYMAREGGRRLSHHTTAPASKKSASAPASQTTQFEGLLLIGTAAAKRDDDALCVTHFSCSLTSWTVCTRSSGSFARQLFIVVSSAEGDKGCTLEIGGGSAARIAAIVEAVVLPSNARWPVTISYNTAPSAKMSLRASASLPSTCSGDMY